MFRVVYNVTKKEELNDNEFVCYATTTSSFVSIFTTNQEVLWYLKTKKPLVRITLF